VKFGSFRFAALGIDRPEGFEALLGVFFALTKPELFMATVRPLQEMYFGNPAQALSIS